MEVEPNPDREDTLEVENEFDDPEPTIKGETILRNTVKNSIAQMEEVATALTHEITRKKIILERLKLKLNAFFQYQNQQFKWFIEAYALSSLKIWDWLKSKTVIIDFDDIQRANLSVIDMEDFDKLLSDEANIGLFKNILVKMQKTADKFCSNNEAKDAVKAAIRENGGEQVNVTRENIVQNVFPIVIAAIENVGGAGQEEATTPENTARYVPYALYKCMSEDFESEGGENELAKLFTQRRDETMDNSSGVLTPPRPFWDQSNKATLFAAIQDYFDAPDQTRADAEAKLIRLLSDGLNLSITKANLRLKFKRLLPIIEQAITAGVQESAIFDYVTIPSAGHKLVLQKAFQGKESLDIREFFRLVNPYTIIREQEFLPDRPDNTSINEIVANFCDDPNPDTIAKVKKLLQTNDILLNSIPGQKDKFIDLLVSKNFSPYERLLLFQVVHFLQMPGGVDGEVEGLTDLMEDTRISERK